MTTKPAITPTIHITKPTDKVPGVDVYTENRDTPINSIAAKISSWTNNFLKDYGAVVPKDTLLEAVRGATQLATGARTMSDVADSVTGIFKFSKTELKQMGAGFTGAVLQNLGYPDDIGILVDGAWGIPGAQPMSDYFEKRSPELRALMKNGEIKKIIDGDFSSASDLSKLLQGVVGDSEIMKVFDGSAQFALLSAAVDSARALNMFEIYDTIKDQIKDDDDRRTFLLDGAASAAASGDLKYLEMVIDEAGIGRLRTRVPEVISSLLSGYTRTSEKSLLEGIQPTLDLLNRIDTHWYQIKVGDLYRLNSGVLLGASTDAIDALLMHPQYRKLAAVASSGKYRIESTIVLFKERYPKSTLAAS